jgi:hypothetical protein
VNAATQLEAGRHLLCVPSSNTEFDWRLRFRLLVAPDLLACVKAGAIPDAQSARLSQGTAGRGENHGSNARLVLNAPNRVNFTHLIGNEPSSCGLPVVSSPGRRLHSPVQTES